MFLNYDLARTILEDRRAAAARESLRREARSQHKVPVPAPSAEEAEVIELVFGRHCETGQIGA